MAWVLWLVGVAVIIGTALAAMGAFGELPAEDELGGGDGRLPGRIPLALFGYRRDVVDRMLAERDSEDSSI